MSLKKLQHLKIPFIEIKHATKNFEKCIGKGGYGDVYYGVLSINGKPTKVAVKRLNQQFGQGLKEFLTEIELLSGQEHENLISLLGYNDEGKEKILVYEYAEHGSLDRLITRSNTNSTTLSWSERLKICVDAARGLDHLHNHVGEHQTIIHRDIKSTNILIGENWVAKVSDLGLSKLSLAGLDRSAVVTYPCGTPGYCEPEYVTSGVVKKESDVYSFGMVLFEVLCGRLCNNTYEDGLKFSAKLAKEYYEKDQLDDIVDPNLRKQMSSLSVERFSTLAYRCLQDVRIQRPPMDVVTKELEEILKLQVEYESEKEEKFKSFVEIEFDTEEYWKMKLPKDIDDIIKMLDSPPSYSSSRELYILLQNGVLFDDGNRIFSITEYGIKCESLFQKAFLKWKARGIIKADGRNSEDLVSAFGERKVRRSKGERFVATGMYPHIEQLNVKCQISTSMLSVGVTYAARLVCSFGIWGVPGAVGNEPNWVWIKWQCKDLCVSSAHFVEHGRHLLCNPDFVSVWVTTLWHFVNDDKNAYFDIEINKILGSRENDLPYVMIHGIDFQPVDMKKQHNGLEGASISGEKIDWAKNMPGDYQSIIDRSDAKLEYATQEELYFLLCGGILIDNGGKWFSICKSTGGKCLMLPAVEILSSNIDHQLVDRLSLSESRFKEVIRLHDKANFGFKCQPKKVMMSRKSYYSCYLVFKFLDGNNESHDTCVLRVSSNGNKRETYAHLKLRELINIPIIKPTKKIKFHDSLKAAKTKGSLLPKRFIDGKLHNLMEQRNDGWMEVLLCDMLYESILSSSLFEVNLLCVEGRFNGFIVQGIEFRPM